MLEEGFYNMDCVAGMKQFPDGYFDLAIVDPPYGDGNTTIGGGVRDSEEGSAGTKMTRTGGTWAKKYGKKS